MWAASKKFVWLGLVIVLTAPASAQNTSPIDELWQAALEANPDIKPTEVFYRKYAAEVLPIVKHFDGFISVLKKAEPYACKTNLLCRDVRIVPGFRVGEKPTAIDLIRYVRTSTCFGFLPDSDHQLEFLKQLERVLKASDIAPKVLLPKSPKKNDPEAHFVLFELANLRDAKGELFVTKPHHFPYLSAVLIRGGAGRGKQRPTLPPLEPDTVKAAYQACENAYGKPPYRH